MDLFEHDDATLAARSETTLDVNSPNGVGAETFQLQFTHDNPSNTSILDMANNTLYTVKTSHEPATVTVLEKVVSTNDGAANEELFSLEWHDVLSDKISIRGSKPVYFSSILSPVFPLSPSRKFTYDGKRYWWSNLSSEPQLFVKGTKNPVAQFRKSRKAVPPHIQARLKNDLQPRRASITFESWILSSPGLLDMILITFLPMAKSARVYNAASANSNTGGLGPWMLQ